LRQEWICVDASLPVGQSDVFSELCWELDSVGVEEIPQESDIRFKAFFGPTQSIQSIENSFKALARDHSITEFQITRLRVDPNHWVREYRKQFHGFPVRPNYYIHPPWEEPSKLHPLNLRIKPGRAFGTGTHESTQLSLYALAALLPGSTNLLDVGTGSGILAIAARKLSANLEIVAMDSDPEATSEARRNSYGNQVENIRFLTGDLTTLEGSFDLVVANLTLGIFGQIASDLVHLTGHTLIVSGFTDDQAELVLDQFALSLVNSWSQNGWCCHQLSV